MSGDEAATAVARAACAVPHGVLDRIERYVDEGETVDLEAALAAIGANPVHVADLLDGIARIKGDTARRQRAMSAVRATLGLPVIPGPVCRS